jgi:hypothetical protein
VHAKNFVLAHPLPARRNQSVSILRELIVFLWGVAERGRLFIGPSVVSTRPSCG